MATHKRQNDEFSQRVRDEREAKGWTQRQLAELLGWHWTVVAKVENGQRSVKVDEAADIADLFGVSVDTLLGRKVGLQNDVTHVLRGLQHVAGQATVDVGRILGGIQSWTAELERYHFTDWQDLNTALGKAQTALGEAQTALWDISAFELPSEAVVKLRDDILEQMVYDKIAELLKSGSDKTIGELLKESDDEA